MIPPDQEIYDVEQRIAERRHRVEAVARQTGQAAMRTLTSPWTLAGAAAIGFLVAARFQHRSHAPSATVSKETKEKAKGGAIASLAMAAATWLVKSQFGSPVQMAQFFLSKAKTIKKQPPQPVRTSPRSDRATATTRR
jgi:hypothetical protein